MSKLEMKNLNGEKVKDIKLNDNVFGIEPMMLLCMMQSY